VDRSLSRIAWCATGRAVLANVHKELHVRQRQSPIAVFVGGRTESPRHTNSLVAAFRLSVSLRLVPGGSVVHGSHSFVLPT
jgi:hypothetical protein